MHLTEKGLERTRRLRQLKTARNFSDYFSSTREHHGRCPLTFPVCVRNRCFLGRPSSKQRTVFHGTFHELCSQELVDTIICGLFSNHDVQNSATSNEWKGLGHENTTYRAEGATGPRAPSSFHGGPTEKKRPVLLSLCGSDFIWCLPLSLFSGNLRFASNNIWYVTPAVNSEIYPGRDTSSRYPLVINKNAEALTRSKYSLRTGAGGTRRPR